MTDRRSTWNRTVGGSLAAGVCWLALMARGAEPFAQLEPGTAPAGYLARLLINETPFPGERGYVGEQDTKAAMLSVLWVLHSRIHFIPTGYTQQEIASVRTQSILDVIMAPNQCEGFHRDAAGQPAFEPRVKARVENLLRIANGGGKPGRFAGLLHFAQGLANAYLAGGIPGADRFAQLEEIDRIPVTGRAYSWMTGQDVYHPGGNFVTIPDARQGLLGGNRFFTLRKEPQ
ncbi:MAG: hypothetical protein EOM10_14975 [Opitutae bacterium]|nr:hypothetical protein [Opitutae bacterium]